MPTGSTFDASMPTGSTFDGSLPTGSTFDGSLPTGSTFDGSMPTGSTFDASMPTGSTFEASMPTGSTFDGSLLTGSTSGSTIAPTTESVEALSQRASAASEAKEAAEAEIAAAAEKKEAAESVSSELGNLDMNNFKDGGPGRRRRQSETTTTYAIPGSCNDVKTAMDDITNALDGTNDATYNPTRAVAIVAILTDLTSSDLADQVCTDSDVSELDNKKTTSLAKAAEAVATETNKIAAATEDFNDAVALINTINEALLSQGASTVEAAATIAAVATVTGGLTDAATTTATGTATTLSQNPSTITDTTRPGRR